MKVEQFHKILNADFFTGVPDSQLRALCDFLVDRYGTDQKHHVVAANEGNAVALAAGYHLATGKTPVVYMQNSGQGNVVNPLASLLNEKVYAIPCVFVVGWRGEPNVHDEPQHIFQGEITLKLFDVMQIPYFVIDKNTAPSEVKEQYSKFKDFLKNGKQVAFIIKKGALQFEKKVEYKNTYKINREKAIERVVNASNGDPIISTTGKISRELFEIREKLGQGHKFDFLTVGSMGHSSSIALGVALNKPNSKIWCLDGDGAMLMHMGSLAVIGAIAPRNLIHVVINNCAHESVGGMPTVANSIDICGVAKSCGYKETYCVKTLAALESALKNTANNSGLTLIEIKCALGSRADLGRPTTTTFENKKQFMKNLKSSN